MYEDMQQVFVLERQIKRKCGWMDDGEGMMAMIRRVQK